VRVGAFPAGAAFLPSLASLWLADKRAAHEGVIVLPSRRAALALAGAFLTANGGRALLLPRIVAVGAFEDAGLAGALDVAPEIPAMRRQAMLAQLILRLDGAGGAPQRLPAAWALAGDLAALLDEADFAEIDLASALQGVVGAELAAHWQTTLTFLEIITRQWPYILAAEGSLNPAARQVRLLDAQAAAWRGQKLRVWMAVGRANAATARLANVVAGMANGMVILPGFDWDLAQAAWDAVNESHAQGGIAELLGAIGVRREEVEKLPAAGPVAGRAAGLSRALLPAGCLTQWQQPAAVNLAGLSWLDVADEGQEAVAIAAVLRDALEVPGRAAALVTPDRALAVRVTAALRRFGVNADDSAGEALAQTPPALFLRLLARAAAANFAPVELLALLQHPLAAAGVAPAACRDFGRRLDEHVLRGPRPAPGFDEIKLRVERTGDEALRVFVERLEVILRGSVFAARANPAAALRALLEVAEALSETAEEPGAAKLWAGEAGAALSEVMIEALECIAPLNDVHGDEIPDLLDAVMAGAVVRRPRSRDGHPRIAIWGVREAALQTVDVVVLGGLVEGVWPAAAEPGPWLSRPMRRAAGLPSPEQAVGQAAHDFWSLACACGEVVLAVPARRERAPAVPARWVTRLQAMLKGVGQELPAHPAAGWAAQLDLPVRRERRGKPFPKPPAAYRPTTLTVSDFATLMSDPYAIYARKILRLRELAELDEESDPQLFGEIVHAGLEAFFLVPENFAAADPVGRLTNALLVAMGERRPREAVQNWWAARLARIADWVVATEAERREARGAPAVMALERDGKMEVPGGFLLTGRADRIEAREAGVSILDYKSGAPPSGEAVMSGAAPQLPLEAVMAQAGHFGPEFAGRAVTELMFWKVSGQHEAGSEKPVRPKKGETIEAVIARAAAAMPEIFAKFARPDTAFLAAPHPARTNKYDVYGGISRRAEWAGDDDFNISGD
jgi:ATP-dependent helicase/nuclease subunit B